MKTRQQRLAEERAGHPSSPPQQLASKTRGPRRTRAKKPSVGEVTASSPAPVAGNGLNPGCVTDDETHPGTVAAGSVVPAAQLAVPGEPQALLRIWVDAGPDALASGRPVDDPNLELAIPSARVPDLLAFIASRNQAKPQIQEPSQMAPPATATRLEPAPQQASHPVKSPSINPSPRPKNLESQPVPSPPETLTAAEIPGILRNRSNLLYYSADGTAFYGKLPTKTKAPGLDAPSDDHKLPQQLDDEASVNEDSEMKDVSESGSKAGPMAESSLQEATQSNQELTPETPRGSSWDFGNFFRSVHYSARKHFGFSPLTPVSERSEPTPQAQPIMTPTKPRMEKSVLHSAKATRARNRRHNDSIAEPVKPITSSPNHTDQQLSARATRARSPQHNDSVGEPVKPITIGPNHRDQQAYAKKANLTSGSTEATTTEEENSPATRTTNRDQEEARKVQSGEPDMTPNIRFPSRFLEGSKLASKRKRWGSPDAIPNPEGKSYGLGEAEFYGNFEEEDEDDVTEQQPGKLRRTSESEDFSSQVVGDPNRARPYTGPMFKRSNTQYSGDNVFKDYEAARKAEEEATAQITESGQQSLAKTPIPVTNVAGTFKVPSPGDSDWSDSESEEEMGAASLKGVTPTGRKDGELELAVPALSPSKVQEPQQITKPVAESEALRKARDKALKHKPRNPSLLSQSSRTYTSPPLPKEQETKRDSGDQADEEAINASNPGPTGRPKITAYEDWSKTAPPAVKAVVERMEVDATLAGKAFGEALDNPGPAGSVVFDGYEKWCKAASPAVSAALERMLVDPNLAGNAFKEELDNFTTSEKRAEQVAA